ncbi:MAG: SAM-dependent methyltransferase [Pirellula sp.]|nr:SAM-dependent methyltransferase [Pirellula sp.]
MHSFSLQPLFVAVALVLLRGDAAKSQAIGGPAQTGNSAATTPDKIPPGLEFYKGREIAQTMHYAGAPWLTRESRDREEDCNKLLKELKLQPGQTVCDMGCGNGFYTMRIAKRIGAKGLIYAVDIQPEMLSMLSERVKADRVHNVKLLLGTVVDPQLPADSCDVILCVDVYHEFSHPEQMLAAMRKALKPAGRLVLVEFRAEDPQVPIKPEHKMSKEQVLKELPPNGFKLVQEFDGLPWQHAMWFEKDASK